MKAKEKIHQLLLKLDEDLDELECREDIDSDECDIKRLDLYVEFSNDVEKINGEA